MNSWFAFKHFTVEQAGAAMKVGTDGVLLGAWARVAPWQKRLLDVGTGTGLIALMLAQRTYWWGADIDAVEIDGGSFRQASDNFRSSPWNDRLHAMHAVFGGHAQQIRGTDGLESLVLTGHDAQEKHIPTGYSEYDGGRSAWHGRHESRMMYDHIISNPPYFSGSLKAPDERRAATRHAGSLSYGELAARSAELLSGEGLLSVIIPFDSRAQFRREADRYGFHVSRRTIVRSLPDTPPKRVMLEFSLSPTTNHEESELLIETAPGGSYSEEYRRLTKDFYLKF